MDAAHLIHLMLVCTWGGLVLAEVVLEGMATEAVSQRAAARLHFLMDAVLEAPLLLGVVASGAWLAWRGWPLSGLHLVKIGLALLAITANLICMRWVVLRRHAQGNALARLSASIRWTGVGIPVGTAALVLGLLLGHGAP